MSLFLFSPTSMHSFKSKLSLRHPYTDVQFLPISGLMGINMKTRVDKSICNWWNGPCLFEVLDTIEVPLRDPKGPVRYDYHSVIGLSPLCASLCCLFA